MLARRMRMAASGRSGGGGDDSFSYMWLFPVSDGGLALMYGSYIDDNGWSTEALTPSIWTGYIRAECPGGCFGLAHFVTMEVDYSAGADDGTNSFVGVYDSGDTPMAAYQLLTPGLHSYIFDVSGYGTFNVLAFNFGSNNDTGGSAILRSAKVEGDVPLPDFSGGFTPTPDVNLSILTYTGDSVPQGDNLVYLGNGMWEADGTLDGDTYRVALCGDVAWSITSESVTGGSGLVIIYHLEWPGTGSCEDWGVSDAGQITENIQKQLWIYDGPFTIHLTIEPT